MKTYSLITPTKHGWHYGYGFFSNYRICLEEIISHHESGNSDIPYISWANTTWVEEINQFENKISPSDINPFNYWFDQPIISDVEYLYPFKDKNLIEFCVNLPIEYKIREGYNRYTIRKGLENILPPLIQSRNTKMPFSPDYMRRYKKQIPFVLTFLEEIKSNDPIRTIIDISKLKYWLKIPVRDDERGTFAEKVALHLVPQTIYLIHFLRRFDNFKIK